MKNWITFLFWLIAITTFAERFRITVDQDGMYRITGRQLRNTGVPIDRISPKFLSIQNRDRLIPIHLQNRNSDQFDLDDAIIFYGQKLRSNRKNKNNIYWLNSDEKKISRMATHTPSQPTAATQIFRRFRSRVRIEHDDIFVRLPLVNSSDQIQTISVRGGVFKRIGHLLTLPPLPIDSWFWKSIAAPSITEINFRLPSIAETTANATIRVMLHGETDHSSNPDHHTQIWLNDQFQINDTFWNGQTEMLFEDYNISQFFLNDLNTIRIVSLDDTRAEEIDRIWLNWIEIEYWREFRVIDDLIHFSIPMTKNHSLFQIEITNFTTRNISIYGVHGERYTNFTIVEDPEIPDRFRVIFRASSPPRSADETEIQFIAISDDNFLKPLKIEKDLPSDLKNKNYQIDYLIVTDRNLFAGAKLLADHRSKNGLRTKIVLIQDIYDEFNDGIKNVNAIRDFLRYAHRNWKISPKFVVLIGDASLDSSTEKDLIPTVLIQTPKFGAAASDHQFACVDGDDHFPEIAIGRIPASNLIDLNIYVEKIINYEKQNSQDQWRKNVLMLAGAGGVFSDQSDQIIADLIPKNFETTRIYSADPDLPIYGASREVITEFNKGISIVNFLGHGGGSIWSDNRMMTLGDVIDLRNGDKLPIVISMTCFTGYFNNPYQSCLGEAMIFAEKGGAIAFLGDTGFGWILGDYYYNREIFGAIFNNRELTIGEMIRDAKINFLKKNPGYVDIAEMYTLLGDPALKLDLPEGSLNQNVSAPEPLPDLSVLLNLIKRSINGIKITIQNIGFHEAKNIRVRTLDHDNNQIGNDYFIDTLEPDNSHTLIISEPFGNSITVLIDPLSEIRESNESNNFATKIFNDRQIHLTKSESNVMIIDDSIRVSLRSQIETTLLIEPTAIEIDHQPDLHYVKDPLTVRKLSDEIATVRIIGTDHDVYKFDDQKWSRLTESVSDFPIEIAVIESTDKVKPKIELSLGDQGFIDGDFVSQNSEITAIISDANGIDLEKIYLFLNDVTVVKSNFTISRSATNSNVATVSYDLKLESGNFRIKLQASDTSGNQSESEIRFRVAGEFAIEKFANYPNPITHDETHFAYILTKPADLVSLKIYSIAGRKIFSTDELDNFAGYNEFRWEIGETPNGVYFYKVIAERENQTIEKIGKLAILR